MKFDQLAPQALRTALVLTVLGAGTANAQASDDSWLWWPEDSGVFSYTYLQGSYGFQGNSDNQEQDVLEGRLSIGLGETFYVAGNFLQVEDQDLAASGGTRYEAMFGVHGSVSDQLDILLEVGYTNTTVENVGSDIGADGAVIGIGFRGMSPGRHFEAEASYHHRWIESDLGASNDNGNLSFDLLWRATSNLGVMARGAWETEAGETFGTYSAGLRVWL